MTKKKLAAKSRPAKRTTKKTTRPRTSKRREQLVGLEELTQLAKLGSGARSILDARAVLSALRENLSVSVKDRTTLPSFDAAMRLLGDGLSSVEDVVDHHSAKFREAR